MAEQDFETIVSIIRQRDKRYARAAYGFAFFALDYTMKEHLKLPEEGRRHVSARELLEGLKACAIDQFGALARSVWESWGVRTTEDWGNIIYNLIQAEAMKQSDDDKLEHFKDVYAFDEAFAGSWRFAGQMKK